MSNEDKADAALSAKQATPDDVEVAIAKLTPDSTDKEVEESITLCHGAGLGARALEAALKAIAKKTDTGVAVVKKLYKALGKELSVPTRNTALALPDGLDLVAETGEIKSTFENCLILLEDKHGEAWGFAFDEMAKVHMLRGNDLPWAKKFGRELDDDVIRVIRHFLIEQWGVTFKKEDVREACLTLAGYTRFNPLLEYLDALAWDGKARVETWLCDYLGVKDSEYVRAVGKLWLVAAVRRAKQPGAKFDNMLILEGVGGAGKSTAFNVLGGEYFSDAPLGDVENKDAAIQVNGIWIWEMPELSTMNRSTTEAMLAFLSRAKDRYRTPHKADSKTHMRMCVFGGTSNKDAYLTATSGNRRYWPVKVGDEIALDALARDRDQIWAEAVELEKTGMSIFLPKELYSVAGEEQSARVALDPWADELRNYLENLGPECDRVHTLELFKALGSEEVARQDGNMSKRLRGIMGAIGGWQHKNSVRIKGEVRAGYERVTPAPALASRRVTT